MNRNAFTPSDAVLSRREFLQRASLTVAGVAAVAAFGPDALEAAQSTGMRTLGRTGFKVTPITFGGIQITEPRLLHVVIDKGINLIHTAPGYAGGRSIVAFGEVMKTRRKEVVLAVKVKPNQVDEALKTLNTDYIDIAVPDHNYYEAPFPPDELRAEYEAYKKAGKIRFTGFATHRQQATCIRNAVATGFFDVMLVAYNATNREELLPLVREARQKHNMGFMVMKATGGLQKDPATRRLDPEAVSAALKNLMAGSEVDTVLLGMGTFQELDANLKTMQNPRLTRRERQLLEQHLAVAAAGACSLCGKCEVCPKGIPVAEVMRCQYYVARGDNALAREVYTSLPTTASACDNCGLCTRACPKRLNVATQVRRLHAALA
ncbi:MAG: aldo/keto reductase [Armatimonadota bacterium]|nr:aldo/keto reductase [Armatimonadota bacterium]